MIAAAEIASVPRSPGVYFLLDEAHRLVYVGKAASLQRRLTDHSRTPRWAAVSLIAFELAASEANALEREAAILAAIQPPWNKSHIDAFFTFVTPARNGLRMGRDGDYGWRSQVMHATGRRAADAVVDLEVRVVGSSHKRGARGDLGSV